MVSSGQTLLHYRLVEEIGSGGMGVVWRATDTTLDREVAIKVLPDAVAQDVERLSRFEREAKLLASLNHPNIAAVYGLHEVDGIRFLAMELVDGEDLARRLTQGALPVETALRLSVQIAGALEAAHDAGVIHRDLKPANVVVTAERKAKVLDFGLAKSLLPTVPSSGTDPSMSPTVTSEGTLGGVILGTAAYMSPEQARGKEVDRRSDVWSFGCVLYELLTGSRPFRGETVSDVISMILQREPDWKTLPADTPRAVRSLLQRCLRKERQRRLRDIADARIEIEDALSGDVIPGAETDLGSPAQQGKWGRIGILAAGLLLGALGASLYWSSTSPTSTVDDLFSGLEDAVQLTTTLLPERQPSLSPDGRTLAYQAPASDSDPNADIWIRQIGTDQPVNRTAEYVGDDGFPSWSPDGTSIAFWSSRDGGGVYVMPALTGAPRRVFSNSMGASGAPAWSPDGTRIAYIMNDPGEQWLGIQSLNGDALRRIDLSEPGIELAWSPDEEWIAYAAHGGYGSATSTLRVLRLEDGESLTLAPHLIRTTSHGWSVDGRRLFFVSAGDVWIAERSAESSWSSARQATSGIPVQSIALSADGRNFAFARGRRAINLWRVPLFPDRPAAWEDAEQLTFDVAEIVFASVSPDRRTLLFDSDRGGWRDLWRMPINGGSIERLTNHPALDWHPVLSPRGDEIAFYSLRSGVRQVWVMPADGGPARQVTSGVSCYRASWSPDGKELAYTCVDGSVRVQPVDGADERSMNEVDEPVPRAASPSWSPDGQWLAVGSADGLLLFPSTGGAAKKLGELPNALPGSWSADGREIYYLGEGDDGRIAVRAIRTSDGFERPLLNLSGRRGSLMNYFLATDGTNLYFGWRDDLSDIWVTSR